MGTVCGSVRSRRRRSSDEAAHVAEGGVAVRRGCKIIEDWLDRLESLDDDVWVPCGCIYSP